MSEKIKISDELPAGFMIFCSKCGHNISMHSEKRPLNNDNYIDSICKYDNSYFVCDCTGFESDTQKTTKILDYSQQNENIAVVEDSSSKKVGSNKIQKVSNSEVN